MGTFNPENNKSTTEQIEKNNKLSSLIPKLEIIFSKKNIDAIKLSKLMKEVNRELHDLLDDNFFSEENRDIFLEKLSFFLNIIDKVPETVHPNTDDWHVSLDNNRTLKLVVDRGLTSYVQPESHNRLTDENLFAIISNFQLVWEYSMGLPSLSENDFGIILELLEKRFDDIQNNDILSDSFAKLIGSPMFGYQVATYVQKNIKLEDDEDHKEVNLKVTDYPCKTLLKTVVESYDVDAIDCIDTWLNNHTAKERGPYHACPKVFDNIVKMMELEQCSPGSVSKLNKKFGIRNFQRYPKKMLISQCETIDDRQTPFGIMMDAAYDWNGAFDNDIITHRLSELDSSKYLCRIFEAKTKQEVARHLIGIRQKYDQKISFAFISAHGNKDMIIFDDGSKSNIFSISDLSRNGAKRVGDFFEKHATLIFNACSTGVAGGIGEKVQKELGVYKVIAPSIPAHIKDVEFTIDKDGGGIEFDITYDNDTDPWISLDT